MSRAPDARVGTVLGGGAMRHRITGERVYHYARVDLDDPERPVQTIDLPFLAHGTTPSPHDGAQVVVFEKHGPGCAVIDLREGRVGRAIAAGQGRQFYGHGVFSPDGALLYCTETDVDDRRRGHIAVRDGRDFTPLGDFPTYGLAPHDCMFAADGTTLVISNGGSASGCEEGPSITYVDVRTQALIECCQVPDPELNAGHLALASDGALALVSAPRDGLPPETSRGGIALRAPGAALRMLDDLPEARGRMIGETLSVAIHEPTGTVGCTSPLGQLVAFWRLSDQRFLGSLRVPMPRGLALDLGGDAFVVGFGDPPRVARIDARSLQPVDEPGNPAGPRAGWPSLITGSHVVVHAVPA